MGVGCFAEAGKCVLFLKSRSKTLNVRQREVEKVLMSSGINVNLMLLCFKAGHVFFKSQVTVGVTAEYQAYQYKIQSAKLFLNMEAHTPRKVKQEIDLAAAQDAKSSNIDVSLKGLCVLVANDVNSERVMLLMVNSHLPVLKHIAM